MLGRGSDLVGEGVVQQVAEKFTGLAWLGLVWSCWANNRPPSGVQCRWGTDNQHLVAGYAVGAQHQGGVQRTQNCRTHRPQGPCRGDECSVCDHLVHKVCVQAVQGLAQGVPMGTCV